MLFGMKSSCVTTLPSQRLDKSVVYVYIYMSCIYIYIMCYISIFSGIASYNTCISLANFSNLDVIVYLIASYCQFTTYISSPSELFLSAPAPANLLAPESSVTTSPRSTTAEPGHLDLDFMGFHRERVVNNGEQ